MHRSSIREYKHTVLTEQTDPKMECSHSSKSVYHPQRSRDQRKLPWNTSPSNSQSNSEDWMIADDFISHSLSWDYSSLDTNRKTVDYWIVSNVWSFSTFQPIDFYSRVWKTTSTTHIAITTDNIQKNARREVGEQLGGRDHKI